MNYFIADCHFFHSNILKLNPLKRRKGFEDVILENLRAVLTEDDALYVIGDFAWKLPEGFLEKWSFIPGRKFLIKGNHDWWFREEELYLFFEEVYDFSYLLEVRGKRVLLCHFPSKDLRTYRYTELQERVTRELKENNCSLLVHGHVHWNPYGVFCGCHLNCVKCINVNVEFTGFRPVSEEELPLW
ncbi:calcineurin-like phosphoesterase family protein [Thermovibrio guaymasensis]|uniref:Calcineurin-like phosphoesterase family protein n=1 Tax=Thermovibrio guaymasensis TaxID=240167 RepID=A0A420W9S3_9BACT|nr:metallophosphoesterase [Thermovibrio guaymasensis]RKQ64022.1 calcineurin-like phosphoesterase family protein [Thermovibrio guaymasensis]